jgi:prephenate dehydratase
MDASIESRESSNPDKSQTKDQWFRSEESVMADETRQVEHYSATIPDKLGEGSRMLGALRDAGVNLVAFWGYPSGKGKAQLEFIAENGSAFVTAAKQAKLRVRKRTALYVHGNDRPGAIADILKTLAAIRRETGPDLQLEATRKEGPPS